MTGKRVIAETTSGEQPEEWQRKGDRWGRSHCTQDALHQEGIQSPWWQKGECLIIFSSLEFPRMRLWKSDQCESSRLTFGQILFIFRKKFLYRWHWSVENVKSVPSTEVFLQRNTPSWHRYMFELVFKSSSLAFSLINLSTLVKKNCR